MGWLSDTFKGKKYTDTTSYDFVAPDYSFYKEFEPKLYEQAVQAPEVNLNVGSYTPYGKIMDVSDTGQGYNQYLLREVLNPDYNFLGKEFKGESWQTPEFYLRATGQLTGGPDIATRMIDKGGLVNADELSDLTKQWLKSQDYMTEIENLGKELSGYYTPYELYAGLHTGQGTDIGWDPTLGFDYSGQTKSVGKRHNQTHYFDPEWEAVRRYDFENSGPLLNASMDLMPTLQDTSGWDWSDNTIYDPNYGYFTIDAPESEYDYIRNNESKSNSYRKGGLLNNPIFRIGVNFIPGIGPALSAGLGAVSAIVNKNPLGAIMSALPYVPGVSDLLKNATGGLAQYYADATGQALNSAVVQGLTQGTIGAGMGGLQGLLTDQNPIESALYGGLTGGLTSGLSTAIGYDFLPKGSAGSQYINPAINKALTSAAVSGILGQDMKQSVQNSLLNSAWRTAGTEFSNSSVGRDLNKFIKSF